MSTETLMKKTESPKVELEMKTRKEKADAFKEFHEEQETFHFTYQRCYRDFISDFLYFRRSCHCHLCSPILLHGHGPYLFRNRCSGRDDKRKLRCSY